MATLTQLEYLVAVDRTRHFGRAAEECHVSQPSLSMQIQKLEEELGVILFDRSKKPILPTQAGMAIIEQARVVLAEQRRLIEMSHSSHTGPRGDFRLGVIPTLSPYLLPLFIHSFAQFYPQVNLLIEEATTSDILSRLDDDRLDAGLMVTPLHNTRLTEHHLFYEPFFLYVNPQHPLFRKSRIREQDLSETDIWLLGEGHCLRNQVVRVCSLRASRGVIPNVRFESGNLETLRSLVDSTPSYTLLPFLAVQEIQKTDHRRQLKPFEKPVPTREVSLVHQRRHVKEATIAALVNSVRKSLPKPLLRFGPDNTDVIEIG